MQRRFRWLIKVNEKSVFAAPMIESKHPLLANERPLTLTFTTTEEYHKLLPAGQCQLHLVAPCLSYICMADYQAVNVPIEDTSIEAEFDTDIQKAEERLSKMAYVSCA